MFIRFFFFFQAEDGIRDTSVTGVQTCALPIYNPIGTVHAGFAATLLDSAMACAVHSTLKRGDSYTTLEFKINLVRALTAETSEVRAEGRLLHRGRTVATSEADLKDAAGKVYAHATTTCIIFPTA